MVAANGVIALMVGVPSGDGLVLEAEKANFTYATNQDGSVVTVSWDRGAFAGETPIYQYIGQEGDEAVFEAISDFDVGYLTTVSNEDGIGAFAWVVPDFSASGAVGAAHFGTAATAVPTTGTLAYSGPITGNLLDNENVSYELNGSTEIVANFGTGAVGGTLTNLDAPGRGALPDIFFAGSMVTGTAAYDAVPTNWGGQEARGIVVGAFYGPGARSTAGAFDVTRPGGDSVHAIGAYVAGSQ